MGLCIVEFSETGSAPAIPDSVICRRVPDYARWRVIWRFAGVEVHLNVASPEIPPLTPAVIAAARCAS